MFANCFPNTLDTTVHVGSGDFATYIITGDIDAMWLRDSAAQVHPYVLFCAHDSELSQMVAGLIRSHADCILRDPYANAFYNDAARVSEWQGDGTEMRPGVHERKWELDSLCYPIRLCWHYWKATGSSQPFDTTWMKAMRTAIETMRVQQRQAGPGPYAFRRRTTFSQDTAPGNGFGNPWRSTGMICSTFRNSDDAAIYLFNIPENLFAVAALRQLAEMLDAIRNSSGFADECRLLASEVEQGVQRYGIAMRPEFGPVYVYECDGFGNVLFMDDAGLPSLVSIPYLDYGSAADTIYQNTRRFALSEANPYFFRGKAAEGTGSPHTSPHGKMIWHLGVISRALTSTDDDEIALCLRMLRATHAGTGFMHESFDQDDASRFTRKWFAWANTLFGELIVTLARERPHLLSTGQSVFGAYQRQSSGVARQDSRSRSPGGVSASRG